MEGVRETGWERGRRGGDFDILISSQVTLKNSATNYLCISGLYMDMCTCMYIMYVCMYEGAVQVDWVIRLVRFHQIWFK